MKVQRGAEGRALERALEKEPLVEERTVPDDRGRETNRVFGGVVVFEEIKGDGTGLGVTLA